MEPRDIADFARNFTTMIRVKGPDPKGLKMRNHAFHHHHSGVTTLSASGFLLPDNLIKTCELGNSENFSHLNQGLAVVVCVASVVEPFLATRSKDSSFKATPELVPYAQIHVMVERRVEKIREKVHEQEFPWFHAQMLRLVDVSVSSVAIKSLIEASSQSLENSWEIGWSLASVNKSTNPMQNQGESTRLLNERGSNSPSTMGKEATRLAFLLVPEIHTMDLPEIMISTSCNRGDFLLAMGSPFGILSPLHFFNSVSAGSVSNCYPPTLCDRSLLMADIQCLPGMEGAPVFGKRSHLIGLLTRPLRQRGGAEVQLVIPWETIKAACRESCQYSPLNMGNDSEILKYRFGNSEALNPFSSKGFMSSSSIQRQTVSYHPSSRLEEKSLSSICLVLLEDGVWASGIVLNNEGLILTNAHLLEPWRYAKSTFNSSWVGTTATNHFVPLDDSSQVRHTESNSHCNNGILMSNAASLDHLHEEHGYHQTTGGQRRIRVRLGHITPWVWSVAKVVYVSRGNLDVSLLQLESVPVPLCPINMDITCPAPGSKAYVVGHGLFGPRCELLPSFSSGVISKVVKSSVDLPAMIETTAAVHPGGSGGAIVNAAGHMIGLVTSNAKHGGGTVIPHMNFSIPCAALESILKFARDMKNTSVLGELDQSNKELSSVWAMTPHFPAEPDGRPQSIPRTNGHTFAREPEIKPRKGSRFSKFMAERQGELFSKDSRQMNSTGRNPFSRDKTLSKL